MSVSSHDYTLREVEQFIDLVHWIAKSSTGDYSEKPDGWREQDGDWGCPLTRDEYVTERAKNIIETARVLLGLPLWDYDE